MKETVGGMNELKDKQFIEKKSGDKIKDCGNSLLLSRLSEKQSKNPPFILKQIASVIPPSH